MSTTLTIGNKTIGPQHPVYIIGEIGINHNGDMDVAKKLIDAAVFAGMDAVKFQKRDPEVCVPPDQRDIQRDTPWGRMTYLDYRYRVEFDQAQYAEINAYCKARGIDWFASCWDEPSVDFIDAFNPVCYKIASASITHEALVRHTVATGRPIIMSTGMSSLEEIDQAFARLDKSRAALMHTTSTYPCKATEINLRAMASLHERFGVPVGYSGHETGLQITLAAVALGATMIERHITLDRAMWGSDQAASVEPMGMYRLVRDIRTIEQALGDGVKCIYESEVPIRRKLRGN